ncbi:MAG TPA: TPM domain-containing protein [Burkholderiales bacterium]|jgi:uncharacterized membrane protein|nr:TPM domain-containing protein [Burkholderiales bacterium]
MKLQRILKHLAMPHWTVRRAFPARVAQAVERGVRAAETAHDVELRVVVEGGLPLASLVRGTSSRERAIELFSNLRVWDTEKNTGVLIYLQFVDRKIEIVADRGISARVRQDEWDAACAAMADEFRAGRFEQGTLRGIEQVAALLKKHLPPPQAGDRDELPDAPIVI